VLMVNPVGELLQRLTHSPMMASMIINSLFGGAAVALSFRLFAWLFGSRREAALLSVLFGVTASQMILSAVPGTSTMAVCSLLVTMNLFAYSLRKMSLPLIPWILAGIFTLGVTTTNVIQTVICFGAACLYIYGSKCIWYKMKKSAIFLVGVVGITAVLAIIQKVLYPSTVLFFAADAYTEDMHYASLLIFQNPGIVLWQLFKNFFMVNIIAPNPVIFAMEGRSLPAVTFTPAMQYTFAGYAGTILWLALTLTGIILLVNDLRKKSASHTGNRIFLIAASMCLLFNLVLHSFYGVEHGSIEYFLYSANFTFLVVTIMGLLVKIPERITNLLLIALILCTLLNNLLVFVQIFHVYTGIL
jgi:hypothetical protein